METQHIAKAGWLHRRSTVLHRWKKFWFVLRADGDLLYFESQDVPRAEGRIVVRAQVARIKPASECDVNPPEGLTKGCLLGLDMREGETVFLGAENPDDMKAWQIALEEARVMATGPQQPVVRNVQTVYTGPYGYPGQVMSYPGQQVIYTNTGYPPYVVNGGNPNVVYVNDRPRYGMGTGFVAGAAIGTAMMWPYMFMW
ncbi:pleckstrin homology domain-containing family B member 2-like [Gigantopelta aegis]|uniref:pleckstrin homology domain-containing family B member 2-like n=1 Tax=Gigantopelta aegis TaxID=1735272 RepID=UPI001B8883CF|nr:pleckstrin homology domain-containing family B member 2-like [Gigantopelta aegis]XP_041355432.1 pleckstrin homology domain-containing family B member 2-like [Gigantopelta aegis]XP_041355439.1 pleckstrin homology domain-containing family B member 2-like [Gigantopelta aegis]